VFEAKKSFSISKLKGSLHCQGFKANILIRNLTKNIDQRENELKNLRLLRKKNEGI